MFSVLSYKYSAPGLTALEAAAQAGAGDIVELLLAAEPSLACGRAWFLAAAGGHLTILQIFSSHGVEEDMRGIDPAKGGWDKEGNEEGANKISPSGTFSDAALALPFRRTATSAS